ncbi:MAG: small multi-drug export protein [Archaeoglobi archaeon]|jgi:uncharacterized membrane protein|nr:small multi-drug export protein [Archaeoglobi archaeon]
MNLLQVLLISASPILELRGGIPLAIYLGFSPAEAYIISIIGNFLPVPLLLIGLNRLIELFSGIEPIWSIYKRIEQRVERKKGIVEKYGYIGLLIFVAVPLPASGAWTGCLIATLLKMDRIKSTISILIGICIAGLIVILPFVGLSFIN